MLGVEKPIDDTRKQLGEAWSTVQRSDSGFNLGRRAIGAGAISSLHSSSQTQSPIDSACEGRVGVHRNCVQQRFVATNPADDQPRHIENVVATHGIRGLAGQRISLNEHAGDGTIGALRNHEYGAEVGDGSDDEVQTILHSRASKGYTKLPTRPDGDDELPTMHVQSPSRVMGIGAEEAKDDGFPTVLLSKSASKVGPAPAGADTSGIRQIGHFTVLHEIAEGGMGVVYAALDEQLGRKVAIKLLTAKGDQAGQADERMIREARAMARLSHPNVVQVHEVGTFDGKTFVAMEYVEGLTLRKWLKQGLTWMEVLDVFRQAGQGLAAAHKQGIVHRDFKPENVVVSKDQRVKVLDFGLARWKTDGGEIPISSDESQSSFEIFLSESNDGRSLTQTGHVLGTPAYMSPEQFEGKTADGRSDQFGFCVALYEALYGHRPFRGRTYAKLARAITKGSPLLPPEDTDVPKWVHKVVMRGLSRDPDDRFPSMEALLTGFEDFKANVDAYNTEMLRLESGLGTIMVLAFWILDWMFVADHVYLALFIRLGIGGAALIIHMLCRRRQRFVERNIDNLSLAINILTGWGMCVIIWLAGGYESAYYAGLNLLVLSLGIMFLWTVRRALLLNGIIYGFYMLPLVFGIIEVHEPDVVLSNQFFLLSTMIIVMTAQRQRYAQERRRTPKILGRARALPVARRGRSIGSAPARRTLRANPVPLVGRGRAAKVASRAARDVVYGHWRRRFSRDRGPTRRGGPDRDSRQPAATPQRRTMAIRPRGSVPRRRARISRVQCRSRSPAEYHRATYLDTVRQADLDTSRAIGDYV